jgi:hypothetical protein
MVAAIAAIACSVNVAAAQAPSPSVAGTWAVTFTSPPCVQGCAQTYTYTETSPGTYTYANGLGWYTTDVPITGSSATVWICGNGGTYSQADEGACPAASGYWIVSETFNLHPAPGRPETAKGTVIQHNPDGTIGTDGGPFTATGPAPSHEYVLSGTITKGCGGSCGSRPKRIAGVTVRAEESTGASASATTNRKGAYKLRVTKGDWTVTPSRASYRFSPPHRRVHMTKSVSGVDFVGCGRAGDEQASVSDASTGAVTPGLYENKKSIPEDESPCAKEFFEVTIKKDGNLEASWDAGLALPRDPLMVKSKIFKFVKKGPLPVNTPIRLSAETSDTNSAEVTITIPSDAPARVLLNNALAKWKVLGDLYEGKINLKAPNHALTYELAPR